MANETTLTDLLPEGTSFDGAWLREGVNNVPFPPDKSENGLLTWELGTVQPGSEYDINLHLRIDSDAEPLSSFENCAKVETKDLDVRPFDNRRCVVDVLQPAGTNLRIEKSHEWWDDNAIKFSIRVWNIGSTTVDKVKVIDTYPEFTSFNGNWWHDLWEPVDLVNDDTVNRKLTWEIDRLDPGWSFEINLVVDLDQDKVGVQGLGYTNYAEMPVDGDVYPDDNESTNTAYSGPDLYVRKWLLDEPEVIKPGDDISFLVEFGNHSQRWSNESNTILEDLLPNGLQYVRAGAPDDVREEWTPRQDGNKLQWFWGGLNSDERQRFELQVKVMDDVDLATILTNEIEIISTSTEDVDPVQENNKDTVDFYVGKAIYLPVIMKK